MTTSEEVINTVGNVLNIPVTEATSRDIEPRWDSLKHVEVMFSIEDACGVQFTQDQLGNLRRVAEIIVTVEQLRGS